MSRGSEGFLFEKEPKLSRGDILIIDNRWAICLASDRIRFLASDSEEKEFDPRRLRCEEVIGRSLWTFKHAMDSNVDAEGREVLEEIAEELDKSSDNLKVVAKYATLPIN